VEAGYLDASFGEAMMAMVGFRNRIVHLYWDVDVERLYQYLQQDVPCAVVCSPLQVRPWQLSGDHTNSSAIRGMQLVSVQPFTGCPHQARLRRFN